MLRPLDCFDDKLIKPLISNGSVISFDTSILLRLARLDMLDCDIAALGPFQKLAADEFRAVVDPNACRLTTPFDDLVHALIAKPSRLKLSKTLRSRKAHPSPKRSAKKC